jgi:hypothetical protein
MHRLMVLGAALAALVAFGAHAQNSEWSPDAKTIGRLESIVDIAHKTQHFSLPAPKSLTDYTRFYAGITEHGHKVIRGIYLSGRSEIRVVREADLPAISDGGCMVISVEYDTMTGQVASACNGIA